MLRVSIQNGEGKFPFYLVIICFQEGLRYFLPSTLNLRLCCFRRPLISCPKANSFNFKGGTILDSAKMTISILSSEKPLPYALQAVVCGQRLPERIAKYPTCYPIMV